ncbi:MAG: TetR family transcriptional regulator C-terminal domain-containing protein, partial [Candidatus Competibacter sp.]|nr:TetR family transcriptional regulator C-terminal domain-containing protein [Candidatus Competibacter sp.]
APKGVLYHHFPGGKMELAVAAIQAAVAYITVTFDRLQTTHVDPGQVLRAWLDHAQKQLEQSAFERGCPLATVALESTADDYALRQALAQGFGEIRERLARLLSQASVPPVRAAQLSMLMVATYEGALIQARVAGSVQPIKDIAEMLVEWVRFEIKPKD